MAVDFETSTYGLLIVIMILLVGMCCERYHQSRNTCCKCHRNGTECKCIGGPVLNALNGLVELVSLSGLGILVGLGRLGRLVLNGLTNFL